MTGAVAAQDFRRYHNLESYLFDTVHRTFHEQGYLSAFDFFCIVIWKANRAKSKIAGNLLVRGSGGLEETARELTEGIARQSTPDDKLLYLLQGWGFRLPMASAILTVLYPRDFTVYDVRVAGELGIKDIAALSSLDRIVALYREFVQAVQRAAPAGLTLRDKDRYLWGKSFWRQLTSDIKRGFTKAHVSQGGG
jgi:hypothetical protein